MSEYCVVVADGNRARFFILNRAEQPGLEPGPTLAEEGEALVNAEAEAGGGALFGDSKKTGRGYSSSRGVHGYDDNREDHMDEFKRRFAKQIAERAVQMAARKRSKTLVLAAEKRMLGFLRDALEVPAKATFTVRELAKDVSRLEPHELHSHLAGEGLIPARRRPS